MPLFRSVVDAGQGRSTSIPVLGAISSPRPEATSPAARIGRTTLQKSVFLFLFFGAVLSLPYLITPSPTISRSYVAGYSNRTAVVLFLLGIAAFAWFTRGEIARREDRNSRLSRGALGLSLLVTFLACLTRSHVRQLRSPGGECAYFLNRQQLLSAGFAPYRQFEFGYGPLLLYPSLWAQRLLHSSVLRGYVVAWIAEALLGTVMIWVVVRLLDVPVRSRAVLFGFLLLSQLIWVDRGGLSYTAFRGFSAAFCIAVAHAAWKRTQNLWAIAGCCILFTALTTACSVDQAIGVAFGLNAYLLLLALVRKGTSWIGPLSISILGSLACFVLADRWGMLLSLKSFGSGGYSYPLLPSLPILLTLFAYVVAACVFYKTLMERRWDSVMLPLTLGGVAMLPAALGRSDILHISAATPIFAVGVAGICSMPRIRSWWLPLALISLILLPPALERKDAFFAAVIRHMPALRAWAQREADFLVPSQNQSYLSAAKLPETALPCDRTYYSPSLMPLPLQPFRPACLDTGYYLGFTNVITPATIESKLQELRTHAANPLLMETTSLEDQIPLQLATMDSLHVESGSFWVPPRRRTPLTYAPIIAYIRAHYVPGPLTANGHLRIWNPRPVQ